MIMAISTCKAFSEALLYIHISFLIFNSSCSDILECKANNVQFYLDFLPSSLTENFLIITSYGNVSEITIGNFDIQLKSDEMAQLLYKPYVNEVTLRREK